MWTSQNRWVTHLPAELTPSLDLVPKDPFHWHPQSHLNSSPIVTSLPPLWQTSATPVQATPVRKSEHMTALLPHSLDSDSKPPFHSPTFYTLSSPPAAVPLVSLGWTSVGKKHATSVRKTAAQVQVIPVRTMTVWRTGTGQGSPKNR